MNEEKLFDVKPKKHVSKAGLDRSATQLVPEESIAVVTRVGVGKLAYMPFPYTTSQDFLSLSGLKVEPMFAAYSIYQMLQGEVQNVQGTSIKGITKEDLLSKEISVPIKAEEQVLIGSYLRKLDDLITLHQRKVHWLVDTWFVVVRYNTKGLIVMQAVVFNRELDFEKALIEKLTSECGWSPVVLKNKTERN